MKLLEICHYLQYIDMRKRMGCKTTCMMFLKNGSKIKCSVW